MWFCFLTLRDFWSDSILCVVGRYFQISCRCYRIKISEWTHYYHKTEQTKMADKVSRSEVSAGGKLKQLHCVSLVRGGHYATPPHRRGGGTVHPKSRPCQRCLPLFKPCQIPESRFKGFVQSRPRPLCTFPHHLRDDECTKTHRCLRRQQLPFAKWFTSCSATSSASTWTQNYRETGAGLFRPRRSIPPTPW